MGPFAVAHGLLSVAYRSLAPPNRSERSLLARYGDATDSNESYALAPLRRFPSSPAFH